VSDNIGEFDVRGACEDLIMPRRLVLDDLQLRAAVADATNWLQVARRLRPARPNGIYEAAKRRTLELGLDISHFNSWSLRARWTDADLRRAVMGARSVAAVLRELGLVPAGGNYDQINRRIRELGLDTSHFTGCGWLKGQSIAVRPAAPIEEVLVAGRFHGSHKLKKRLFKLGLKHPACELCGWAERAPDGRIPVELDHINGDRFDNRIGNLRILCPNCHSLQPTHRGLNQRRAKVKSRAGERGYEWAAPRYSVVRTLRLSGCRTSW
jgi:hypothetical protein